MSRPDATGDPVPDAVHLEAARAAILQLVEWAAEKDRCIARLRAENERLSEPCALCGTEGGE